MLQSGHVSVAVKNWSQHWYLLVHNWHSHGKMKMDANAVQQWGEKCTWFSGNTVNGAAGSGRNGAKSGPTSAADKFDQILKWIIKRGRVKLSLSLGSLSLSLSIYIYIYIYMYFYLRTFLHSLTSTKPLAVPTVLNCHLIDGHSSVKKWWRFQDPSLQTVWDGDIGRWKYLEKNWGGKKPILTTYIE